MKSAVLKLIVLLLTGTALVSRGQLSAEETATAAGVAFFEKNIRPLLVSRCYSCHSDQSNKSRGGLRLDSEKAILAGGTSGKVVVPGDVEASLLIKAIRYSDRKLKMPPGKPLPPKSVALLEQWVKLGVPIPMDRKSDPDLDDPSDPIAGRQHWAFRPLSQAELPGIGNEDWPRSAIDHFVLARLEQKKLSPATDADRRTLARRVFIQLIGLPPTPKQMEALLRDSRPDAFERLVDQLLESPHFGERWGRHWLDLARYADSNGLDENFLFREAWRYRNRIIDSFNEDTPFDRFLREQIAGDLLPHDSIEQRDRQRISAGFLVVGPKVLLGNNPDERRMDVADEQLDTIGRTVLGLTLGCARCHDHKFDPIPTRDYYALAGILTSTQVMERRYMLGSQRLMERLQGIGSGSEAVDDAYEKYWRERSTLLARAKDSKAALELLKKGDEDALQNQAKEKPDTVAVEARDAKADMEKRLIFQTKLVEKLAMAAKAPPIPPRAMIPQDVETPADEHIRVAGQFDELGEKVPRGFLRVVSDPAPNIEANESGRLKLARWLTDTEHGAGHLAARVLANRIWHHVIGRGIVRTVDNFGRTGEAPTHPQLLDHLAGELITSGWSIKSLIRKIVLSRTFAMSSGHSDAAHAVDPENNLLWRAHRRRLAPEVLRDAMLQAAGTLDLTPRDSSVWYLGDQATAVGANKNRRRTNFPNRSVYLPVIRNDLPELFDVFDFADPHATTGLRPETMVATQGLFLLNDESVQSAAETMAKRLLTAIPDGQSATDTRIDHMFELILNAEASDEERQTFEKFLKATQARLANSKATDDEKKKTQTAWSIACHALFASSRFQILE